VWLDQRGIATCSSEEIPCYGKVPITVMRLGCRRRIQGWIEQALV
jgi:hypothetical protein